MNFIRIVALVAAVGIVISLFVRRNPAENDGLKSILDEAKRVVEGKTRVWASMLDDVLRHKYPTQIRRSSENACREILEDILGKQFVSERPDFLRNPRTNRNLECDMINHDLKLCVEYNGEQHYNPNSVFSRNFEDQQYRDAMKSKLLKENGYDLIVVPYTVPRHEFKSYLTDKLESMGYI